MGRLQSPFGFSRGGTHWPRAAICVFPRTRCALASVAMAARPAVLVGQECRHGRWHRQSWYAVRSEATGPPVAAFTAEELASLAEAAAPLLGQADRDEERESEFSWYEVRCTVEVPRRRHRQHTREALYEGARGALRAARSTVLLQMAPPGRSRRHKERPSRRRRQQTPVAALRPPIPRSQPRSRYWADQTPDAA